LRNGVSLLFYAENLKDPATPAVAHALNQQCRDDFAALGRQKIEGSASGRGIHGFDPDSARIQTA
jgi:hypothetical protein